ncbi:MAG: hypothetical protein AB8G99_19425 [Planctomycetaceae bacterium]
MSRKKKGSGSLTKGVGAAVVVAFLLGMYTGIPGFGGGSGAEGNADVDASGGGGPVETTSDLMKAGLEDNVVTVLIDAREFAVLTKKDGQEEYKAASMDQIVQMARAAQGDDTGVRVKVLRRESAKASAEESLRNSLASAGVPATSIYWPRRYIP